LTLPAQQLFSALHETVASLQIAPAGRHELPLSHRPTGSLGFALLQLTPVEPWTPPPQQSASVPQISPVGRQPLGGWQTRRPERCGAQDRLQHSPPHDGMPPSVTPPAQAKPATVHVVAPGAPGWPQVPKLAPADLLQSPPQHSEWTAQTSPVCPQKDPLAHTPPRQSLEQQSSLVAHALPVVRQLGFKGAQAPPVQVPLQHCAELAQAWVSEMHCEPPHVPASQMSVQHSWGLVHALPPGRQSPPPAPPVPLAPPPPPVPPVLPSAVPPPDPVTPASVPPAPPVEMPSTSAPPQPALPRIPSAAAKVAFVSRFLTLCSFE
jgi:hypothetical protein